MARLENGVFDPNYLTPLESEGDYLVVEPATRWVGYAGRQWISIGVMANLRAAAKEWRARTGNPLRVTEGWRSYATQVEYKRRQNNGTGGPAATPGYSNHGLGLALDLGSAIGWGGAPYAAWADIASRHGFSNAEGLTVGEKWHWVGSGVISPVGDIYQPIDTTESDTMNQDQQRVLQELHNAVNGPGGLAEVVSRMAADVEAAKGSAAAAANSAEAARKRIGADLDDRLTNLPLSKLVDGVHSANDVIKSTWGRTAGLGGSTTRTDTLVTRIAAKLGLSTTTDSEGK